MQKAAAKVLHFISNSCDHPYLNRLVGNTDRGLVEIFVGSLERRGELQGHFESAGIATFALNANSRFGYISAIFRLARWLRRNKIDIIQTHLLDGTIVGLLAAFVARTPVRIMTGHHSAEAQLYRRKPTFWLDVLGSRYLATHIIAPSENMKDLFVEAESVKPEKITVIRHGFDHENTAPQSATDSFTEFGFSDRLKLIAIGRITWVKGYKGLIRAFKDAFDKDPRLCLLIVGSGDVSELESLVSELDLTNSVKFAGWRSDVTDLLRDADIFVHNALAESFGMVLVEAMLAEKPVICTNVGVAPELIVSEDNGILIGTDSEQELSHAIIKLSGLDREWDKIGARNREIALQLTSAKMANEHQECYVSWLSSAKNH